MYGEVGHCTRQMIPWVRLNDYFNDTVIDERFFDPEVEGPEGIGNPAAALEGGGAPLEDTSEEPAFVRTTIGATRSLH